MKKRQYGLRKQLSQAQAETPLGMFATQIEHPRMTRISPNFAQRRQQFPKFSLIQFLNYF